MRLSDYAEDLSKHGEGSPIYIKSSHGDITFYVTRFGGGECDKNIKNIKQSLFGPFHKLSDVDVNLVYAHWLVEFGVTKWENLIDDDTKKQVKYSKQKARDLFLNEEYFLSLNHKLIAAAMDFENYLYDQAEEVIDNVKK